MSGLFITFEGGEGVGKSTQARLLTERLRAAGRNVVPVHEPGGTPLGEYIRNWVKAQSAPLTSAAELLLFTASRAELVRRVIRPSLNDGAIVIADRYADSTTVYQGYGRQLPLRQVAEAANALATGGRRARSDRAARRSAGGSGCNARGCRRRSTRRGG